MPLWILWAALAGGVALNVWYAIAWMALPHHHGDFKSLGKATPFDAAARAAKAAAGMYIHPHYKDYAGGFKDPEFTALMKESPRFWMVVMKPGCAMSPRVFLSALALNVLEAFGVAVLVHLTGIGVGCLGCTVLFAAALGVLARFGAFASLAIWMELPWRYVVTTLFDGVVGYALVGAVVHLFR
ncbi:MAG: hypothetical protein JNM10_20080 [Planctomycetia bacterium]|nr:hypothetical protein [Planctomycetia bacterium]